MDLGARCGLFGTTRIGSGVIAGGSGAIGVDPGAIAEGSRGDRDGPRSDCREARGGAILRGLTHVPGGLNRLPGAIRGGRLRRSGAGSSRSRRALGRSRWARERFARHPRGSARCAQLRVPQRSEHAGSCSAAQRRRSPPKLRGPPARATKRARGGLFYAVQWRGARLLKEPAVPASA